MIQRLLIADQMWPLSLRSQDRESHELTNKNPHLFRKCQTANLQRVSVVDAASFDPNRASGASGGVPRVYSGSVLMLQFYPVPDTFLARVYSGPSSRSLGDWCATLVTLLPHPSDLFPHPFTAHCHVQY